MFRRMVFPVNKTVKAARNLPELRLINHQAKELFNTLRCETFGNCC